MADFFDNFLNETHLMVRQTARRFAEKEIRPYSYEWEEAGEFPRELYGRAAEAGILQIGFPEEVGGAGGGAMELVMMVEGLMYGGSTGVSAGLGSHGIALPALVQSENPDLVERFVRPTLQGKLISALGITEPNTGSDVASVRTSAVRDGDDYIVNGAKLFITSGVRADFVTTLVRTGDDPHGGLSFLVIEKDRPGFSVSRALKKTGWLASDTAELAFNDVRVPAKNLVGAEGGGFLTLMRNFQTERLALAAYGAATALVCYEEAARYAQEREAFGRPIGKFQVIRHKLAEMWTRVVAARTLTYQVAAAMDRGQYIVTEVSAAKNFCAEVALQVSYEAVQIHGGMGYMRETVVERLSRDARLLPIGGGTQEIMNEIISRNLGV